MAPARKLPRIIRNPGAKSIPGLKKKGYKKAGPKRGRNVYVLPGAKPKPGASPKQPTDPYAAYADYPFFQDTLRLLDRDQKHHEGYVSGTVAPWLSQALTNLTGVNPAQPGIGPTLNQQYLSNVQGLVGGALDAASAATPMPFAPTTPGAVTASPTAYMTTAAQEAAQGQKSSALQAAQVQSALGSMQANTVAQGLTYALADYAKGLPSLYAQRRSEMRAKMDQFILTFEEENRRARVNESINAMNAQANIALGLANLGLDAADVQRRLDESAFDMQQSQGGGGPAPYGFVQLPDGRWVRDPTVPAATSGGGGGGSTRGTYTPNQLRKEGFRPLPAKAGPKWKKVAVRATDGSLWIKGGSSGGGSSAGGGTAKGFGSLVDDLNKKWNGSSDGPFGGGSQGWRDRFRGNQTAAIEALADWIVENKASFNTGKNGMVDLNKIRRVLNTLGDGAKKYDLVVTALVKSRRLRNSKIV